AVRSRGRALFVRAGLDLAHRNRDLWPRHAVHAGGGLDAARRRPCAGRRVLRRGWPTHARQDRSRRRRAAAVAVLSCAGLAQRSLRGALLGDSGALAGNQRAATGIRAQDADPVVRAADGAARDCSGDPLADRAGEAALMPLTEALAILMVAAVIAALMAGYPAALTLAGVSLMFAVLGHILGVGGLALLGALPQRIYGIMTNDVLLAIPLFIFMGVMLERSDIAGDLLERMGRLFGSLRGGLGYSVVLVGALLAASTGLGDVGADHPALDRAGGARRPAQQRLPGGAARAGKIRAQRDLGERPVRRRDRPRPAAGRALSFVSDRDGRATPGELPGGQRDGCARVNGPARSLARSRRADRRGARLDPLWRGDADRSGFGRRRRRPFSGRA